MMRPMFPKLFWPTVQHQLNQQMFNVQADNENTAVLRTVSDFALLTLSLLC